jgi:hypothetical protein
VLTHGAKAKTPAVHFFDRDLLAASTRASSQSSTIAKKAIACSFTSVRKSSAADIGNARTLLERSNNVLLFRRVVTFRVTVST